MTKSDTEVLDFKNEVDKRKSKLVEVTFTPKTNCQLKLCGQKYNLHTCEEHTAMALAIEINMRLIAASSLPAPFSPITDPDEITICGYAIKDWLDDLHQVIGVRRYEKEKKKLESIEAEIYSLLSDEMKTGMRLNELKELL